MQSMSTTTGIVPAPWDLASRHILSECRMDYTLSMEFKKIENTRRVIQNNFPSAMTAPSTSPIPMSWTDNWL